MSYRAVVFDLFGTLVDSFSAGEYERVLWEMADVIGAPRADFTRVWLSTFVERATGVFASPEASVEGVCRALELRPEPDLVAAAGRIRFAYTGRSLVPRPGALETLAELRARGYRTGLVSDCSAEVPILWPDTPFAPLIDVAVLSCAVGLKKPDPRIYRLACDRLGVDPEECLYVGDGGSRELTGAARVGMHPVLIRAPDEAPDAHRLDAEEWSGPTVSALCEVLALVGGKR